MFPSLFHRVTDRGVTAVLPARYTLCSTSQKPACIRNFPGHRSRHACPMPQGAKMPGPKCQNPDGDGNSTGHRFRHARPTPHGAKRPVSNARIRRVAGRILAFQTGHPAPWSASLACRRPGTFRGPRNFTGHRCRHARTWH